MQALRFPIGPFTIPDQVTDSEISDFSKTIADFPRELRTLTENLTDEDLIKTYRPEGWNVRQLVHHCADSHMNAFIRFKLTLTEVSPTIKPYEEAKWAELYDTKGMAIEDSLDIIKGVHARWVATLQSMSLEDFQRSYIHPEHGQRFRLDQALANYDWHCNHHLAHIRIALNLNDK